MPPGKEKPYPSLRTMQCDTDVISHRGAEAAEILLFVGAALAAKSVSQVRAVVRGSSRSYAYTKKNLCVLCASARKNLVAVFLDLLFGCLGASLFFFIADITDLATGVALPELAASLDCCQVLFGVLAALFDFFHRQ